MFQMLTLLIIVPTCVAGYWFPMSAWVVVAILAAFYFGQLLTARRMYKLPSMIGLSLEGQELSAKYGHYFLMPHASRDFSGAAASVQVGSVVLAAVTWFGGFPWGLLVAVAAWFFMGHIAVSFSPVALIAKRPQFAAAHDEVVDALQAARQR